jgi:three-Cys-motif partner protein
METRFVVDPADGMNAMVVGSWSQQKHQKLTEYIDASRGARKRWPHRCYIDVFCGPGRVVERGSRIFRDGGAVAAWKASCLHADSTFSELFIGDLHEESVELSQRRLAALGAPVRSFVGPALTTVHQIVPILPRGLHFAFLDPYNAEHLDFEIIRTLSTVSRIDILVHFSVMDIQRNIDWEAANSGSRLERVAPGWKTHVDLTRMSKRAFVNAFLDYWKALVQRETRMTAADIMPLITNSNKGPLYRLIMLKRHQLAEKLWNDVGRENKEQKDLFPR